MMRKVIAALCILAAVPAFAQWLPSGATSGPIYYDQGNVGIGTTTPTGLLTVRGAAGGTIYLDGTSTGGYSVLRINSGAAEAGVGGALAVYGTTFPGGVNSSLQAGMTALYGYNEAGLSLSAYHANGGMRFYTGGGFAAHERMRILNNGKVGIGTITPTARLHVVVNTGSEVDGIESNVQTTVPNTTAQTDNALRAVVHQNVQAGATNNASVSGMRGIGYLSGAGTLAYSYGLLAETGVSSGNIGTVTNAYGAWLGVYKAGGTVTNGYGVYVNDVQATNGYAMYAAGANDTTYVAGNVGIGTATPAYKLHVVGNAHVQGTLTGTDIEATYQDIAEWVPATSDLEPGTVVVLNPDATNEVTPSSNAYDSTVAGVVSLKPGVSLGVRGEGKEQVATTGRVRVRVDATSAPIRVGDLLVTSNVSGTAMRSEPMMINGRKFHQPGTIIGKALEPLESGMGEILVLLSMQ